MSSAATYPISTIARLLMLTERRIRQLTQEGVLTKAGRGHYELVPTVQGYIRYLRDRAIGADLPDGGGDHKIRLLKARADIAEYEAERMAGELAPVDEIEKTWTDMVSRFRQRSLAVAPKAAPLVAVETETEVCHEIIETFIHEALAELAATTVVIEDDDHQVENGPSDPAETEEIRMNGQI